jgi:hypothetical protein
MAKVLARITVSLDAYFTRPNNVPGPAWVRAASGCTAGHSVIPGATAASAPAPIDQRYLGEGSVRGGARIVGRTVLNGNVCALLAARTTSTSSSTTAASSPTPTASSPPATATRPPEPLRTNKDKRSRCAR